MRRAGSADTRGARWSWGGRVHMFCPQTWHFTATAVVPGRLTSRGLDLDRWIGDMRGEELSGAFGTQADESRGWTGCGAVRETVRVARVLGGHGGTVTVSTQCFVAEARAPRHHPARSSCPRCQDRAQAILSGSLFSLPPCRSSTGGRGWWHSALTEGISKGTALPLAVLCDPG